MLHLSVEADCMTPMALATVLCDVPLSLRTAIDTARCTIWAWDRLRRHAGLPLLYSPFLLLDSNPALSLTCEVSMQHWLRKWNFQTFHDLYPGGGLL